MWGPSQKFPSLKGKFNCLESGECELIQKNGSPSNDTVRFILRFLLKLRYKEETFSSFVDFVPGINELRLFR